jgi:hypothetical protein
MTCKFWRIFSLKRTTRTGLGELGPVTEDDLIRSVLRSVFKVIL